MTASDGCGSRPTDLTVGVHLELHPPDQAAAATFSGCLIRSWPELIDTGGWRSVVSTPEGGEIGLWQLKR